MPVIAQPHVTGNRISYPGFSPVPVTVLQAIGNIGSDIFLVTEAKGNPLLFCAAHDHKVSPQEYEGLLSRDIHALFIRNRDRAAYEAKLREGLDSILENEKIDSADRLTILQTAAESQIRNSLQLLRPDAAVEQCQQVGTHLARLLRSGSIVPAKLIAMVRHNDDTFVHLMNVASYCILLAQALGIDEEKDLIAIAMGGMLHDIGKRFIPARILASKAALRPEEKELVRSHPQRGYEELGGRDDLNPGQLMMVYQHHERMEGQGYPVGIPGSGVHPWARLCAVVDVFEALTGRRSYRRPAGLGEALADLNDLAGKELDGEMVQCWISIVQKT